MSPGRREALILGAAGVAAAAVGFLVGPALLRLGEGGEGEIPGAAGFQDISGKFRTLGEWRGKVLVCNFWATWCAPCREEIPLLVAASRKYASSGVEIVGIAIDNGPKVAQFAASFKIPYPILVADVNGLSLMGQLGNSAGGLPYTVVAGRDGKVIHRKLGAFKPAELDALLDPLTKG
jgi:thiol-disulfide isomerase/thioredoxin